MNNKQRFAGNRKSKQNGIATILVVVLVGIALTATSLGLMHSIRATQNKQVAVHAATHAQTGLWSGVEAFRQYLLTLDQSGLDSLGNLNSLDIGLDQHYGTLTANNFAITNVGGSTYRVNATLQNQHSMAKATAALGVVFEIDTGGGMPTQTLDASLNFLDDLNVNGNIAFNTPAGTKADLNVDGDITIENLTITPLGTLTSTGTVSINSAASIENIFSNDSVSITQAATVDLVRTKGNLTFGGGGYVTTAWVDGFINGSGNGKNASGFTSESWNSIGPITVSNGWHKLIKTGGTLNIGWVNQLDNAQAVGDVTITNNGSNITSLITEGNISCSGGPNFTSMAANGTATGCASGVLTGQSNTVAVMNPNPSYAIPEFVVDVWPLKSQANYVFSYNSTTKVISVEVSNVNGLADGTYYLGNYSSSDASIQVKSYLCTAAPDSSGNCNDATITSHPVCLGFGDPYSGVCLEYVTKGKANQQGWHLNGRTSAPGIMWFEGDVIVETIISYTTVLASGDITTAGNLHLKSVNYSGYGPVCNGIPADTVKDAWGTAKYTVLFQDQYPKNLCDKVAGEYKPIPLGNIALIAGGYDPSGNNTYSGGNINLGQSTELFGSVLAGSLLTSFGGITVHGYITAAALNPVDVTAADNELDGSTTIDLTSFPSSFDATLVPDMANTCTSNCGGGTGGDRVRVLWSRFL